MTTKLAYSTALIMSLGLLTPVFAQTSGSSSTAPAGTAGGTTVGAGSNLAPVQAGSNTSGIGAGSNTSAVRAGSNSATVGAGSLQTVPATDRTNPAVAPAGTNVGTNSGVAVTTSTARPRGSLNTNRSRDGVNTIRDADRSRSTEGGTGFQGASFPGTPEDAPVPKTLPGTDAKGNDSPRTERAIEASGSTGGTGATRR